MLLSCCSWLTVPVLTPQSADALSRCSSSWTHTGEACSAGLAKSVCRLILPGQAVHAPDLPAHHRHKHGTIAMSPLEVLAWLREPLLWSKYGSPLLLCTSTTGGSLRMLFTGGGGSAAAAGRGKRALRRHGRAGTGIPPTPRGAPFLVSPAFAPISLLTPASDGMQPAHTLTRSRLHAS